jgi:hypothetical protein
VKSTVSECGDVGVLPGRAVKVGPADVCGYTCSSSSSSTVACVHVYTTTSTVYDDENGRNYDLLSTLAGSEHGGAVNSTVSGRDDAGVLMECDVKVEPADVGGNICSSAI